MDASLWLVCDHSILWRTRRNKACQVSFRARVQSSIRYWPRMAKPALLLPVRSFKYKASGLFVLSAAVGPEGEFALKLLGRPSFGGAGGARGRGRAGGLQWWHSQINARVRLLMLVMRTEIWAEKKRKKKVQIPKCSRENNYGMTQWEFAN